MRPQSLSWWRMEVAVLDGGINMVWSGVSGREEIVPVVGVCLCAKLSETSMDG